MPAGPSPSSFMAAMPAVLGSSSSLAPGRGAAGPQLGAVDHGQELDDPEKMLLVLMVKLGDLEHEVTGGLRGRHAFLMSIFKLVKSLVDHRFQHLGGAETLPVFLDHERERIFFLDLAPTQDAADLGIVGLGRACRSSPAPGRAPRRSSPWECLRQAGLRANGSSSSSRRPGSWCRKLAALQPGRRAGRLGLTPTGIVSRTITIETWGLVRNFSAFSTPALLISSTSCLRYHDDGASTPVLSSPTTSPTPSTLVSPRLTTNERSPTVSCTLGGSPSFFFLGGPAPICTSASAADRDQGSVSPGTPGDCSTHPTCLLAQRSGRTPGRRLENQAASFATIPLAHFPVRRTAAS